MIFIYVLKNEVFKMKRALFVNSINVNGKTKVVKPGNRQ